LYERQSGSNDYGAIGTPSSTPYEAGVKMNKTELDNLIAKLYVETCVGFGDPNYADFKSGALAMHRNNPKNYTKESVDNLLNRIQYLVSAGAGFDVENEISRFKNGGGL
jgi:hypothetical protein